MKELEGLDARMAVCKLTVTRSANKVEDHPAAIRPYNVMGPGIPIPAVRGKTFREGRGNFADWRQAAESERRRAAVMKTGFPVAEEAGEAGRRMGWNGMLACACGAGALVDVGKDVDRVGILGDWTKPLARGVALGPFPWSLSPSRTRRS